MIKNEHATPKIRANKIPSTMLHVTFMILHWRANKVKNQEKSKKSIFFVKGSNQYLAKNDS